MLTKLLKIFYVTVQKAGAYKGNFTALFRFSVICTAQKKTKFKTWKDSELIDE